MTKSLLSSYIWQYPSPLAFLQMPLSWVNALPPCISNLKTDRELWQVKKWSWGKHGFSPPSLPLSFTSPELFHFWKCAKQWCDVTAWWLEISSSGFVWAWKSVVFLVFPAVFARLFVSQQRRRNGRKLAQRLHGLYFGRDQALFLRFKPLVHRQHIIKSN